MGKKDKVRNGKFNLIKEENLLDFFEIASNYPNKKIFIKISLHKFSNSKYNEKELSRFHAKIQIKSKEISREFSKLVG
jgi:hypothetical protein